MIQKFNITAFRFLAFVLLIATGFQQLGARELPFSELKHSDDGGYYLNVHQPGLLAAGEQRDWFSFLKVIEKSTSQSRLPQWLANPSQLRNGSTAEARYFTHSTVMLSGLEPPDIIFPFHYFW